MCRPETSQNHHGEPGNRKMNDEIDNLIRLAARSQGWVFREYPPQRAMLCGGCELIVIPAWLWQPRPQRRHLRPAHVVPLRRAG